jgi:general secretion pathway protein G
MEKKNKKAFTLVELLVVIAIISILFIVLVSKVDFATDKAKEAGVQTDFRSFQMALRTVGIENQGFPAEIGELADQLNKNLDRKLHVSVSGSEMTSTASDPWGTEYKLTYARPEGTHGEVMVYSAGPDMKFNTNDDLTTGVRYDDIAGIVIVGESTGENIPSLPDDPNNTPDEPDTPDTPDTPDVPEDEPVTPAVDPSWYTTGLYDANGDQLASWYDLVSTYGFDIESDKTSSDYDNAIVLYDEDLANGVELKIPNTVTHIGNYALQNSGTLAKISMPESEVSIGDYAFFNCVNLSNINLNNISTIGNYAFANDEDLNFNLNTSATSIGEYAFYKTGIVQVNLGPVTTYIGSGAFRETPNLQHATFYSKEFLLENMSPEDIAAAWDGIQSLPDSSSLTIGDGVFYGCINLKDMYLGNNIAATIGNNTFDGCTSLEKVDFGDGLTSVGTNTWGTRMPKEIYIRANSVVNVLGGLDATKLIQMMNNVESFYVPSELVDSYKSYNNVHIILKNKIKAIS